VTKALLHLFLERWIQCGAWAREDVIYDVMWNHRRQSGRLSGKTGESAKPY
jgi:hypothetical protein